MGGPEYDIPVCEGSFNVWKVSKCRRSLSVEGPQV